jgi:glycosyltransferase involved in cell wall biosynthesis
MRIAVIVRDLAPGTGLNLVIQNHVEGLAEEHEIRLFLVFPGSSKSRAEAVPCPYPCEKFVAGAVGAQGRKLSRASRYYGVDLERLGWLESRLAEFRADRLVGFDYNVTPFLGLVRSHAPKILHVVDSEILYYASQFRLGKVTYGALKHLLAAFLVGREHFRSCAALVTVSRSDTASLKRLTASRHVFTIPNGVDYNHFAPGPGTSRCPARVIFCGSLSFLPNVQAVEWFVGRCWNRIRRHHAGAEFLIIGKKPTADLAPRLESHAGVRVVGYVDDIRPHILSSAVSVAPMVSGTGIKNKILEAWALATPIVATKQAVKGLACNHGRDILIAGSAKAFADLVVSLLNDPARCDALGAAGRAHVVANYSWEASRAQFKSVVLQPPKAARLSADEV